MTIEEALELLAAADHGIFNDEDTQAIFAAFEITDIATPTMLDDRSEPKGAYIPWSDGEGSYALASDAAWVAETVCKRLGLKPELSLGRGRQLRNCVREISSWAESRST